MSRFIRLTRIQDELTEEAIKRLEDAEDRAEQASKEIQEKDEQGNDAAWYRNLGLPVPKGLIDPESEGVFYKETVEFQDEDYIQVKKDFLCDIDSVWYFCEADMGTIVFYSTSVAIMVEESIEEINKKTCTVWQRVLSLFT